ncbi:defensin-like protein [Artemisia annua]|uniref:Defensin-like protein n=1 Tax=Artemisia annua TaxID=35608 RepID=A0A2U1KDJ8_ARTAN|nr:defensin-like protein [Artemisia annua]
MASKTFFAIIFALLCLFASQWTVQVAEARVCQSQSHMYHGACLRDHNCALVCRNEGFSGGRCRGFRRRCYCTRLC